MQKRMHRVQRKNQSAWSNFGGNTAIQNSNISTGVSKCDFQPFQSPFSWGRHVNVNEVEA